MTRPRDLTNLGGAARRIRRGKAILNAAANGVLEPIAEGSVTVYPSGGSKARDPTPG